MGASEYWAPNNNQWLPTSIFSLLSVTRLTTSNYGIWDKTMNYQKNLKSFPGYCLYIRSTGCDSSRSKINILLLEMLTSENGALGWEWLKTDFICKSSRCPFLLGNALSVFLSSISHRSLGVQPADSNCRFLGCLMNRQWRKLLVPLKINA